jgi:hypothetical protein
MHVHCVCTPVEQQFGNLQDAEAISRCKQDRARFGRWPELYNICVYMYMYVYMCMYICIYVCIYVYVYMYICMYVYMCMYICMYVYMYIYVYVYSIQYLCAYIIYLCAYLYNTYIYLHLHLYIYIYICICYVCLLRFYYRFPQGESGLDVYNRVTSLIGSLFRYTYT